MGFHFIFLQTKDSVAIFHLLALKMFNCLRRYQLQEKRSNFLELFTEVSGFVKNKGHQNLFFNDCSLATRCHSTRFLNWFLYYSPCIKEMIKFMSDYIKMNIILTLYITAFLISISCIIYNYEQWQHLKATALNDTSNSTGNEQSLSSLIICISRSLWLKNVAPF